MASNRGDLLLIPATAWRGCVSSTRAIKESTRKTNLDFEAPKDRPPHNGSLKRGVITGVGKRPHLTEPIMGLRPGAHE